jgi:general secretion pathway protein A
MQSTSGVSDGGGKAAYQTFFSFFGLRENPFRGNPDPRYLFRNRRVLQALNELELGLQSGKALIVLTGEAGTGKTTLINHLLASLRMQGVPVAFIFNSHLDINNLFDFMLADYGVKYNPGQNPNLRMLLNKCLLENHQAGRTPVLIVDEAQGLAAPVLEEIRMLLNLEAGGEALVRIVLAGQSELDSKLNRPEFRQLRQRIMLRCKTAPLSAEETHGYIRQRLSVAGSPDGAAFGSAAMDAIHFYSGGIPRVMNLLSEHSLINAYSDGVRPVTPEIVEDVAREFRFDDFRPLPAALSRQTAGEVIPIQSSAAKMRMSAMASRMESDAFESIGDARLVSEWIAQSSPASVPVAAESSMPPTAAMAAAASGAPSLMQPPPVPDAPIAAQPTAPTASAPVRVPDVPVTAKPIAPATSAPARVPDVPVTAKSIAPAASASVRVPYAPVTAKPIARTASAPARVTAKAASKPIPSPSAPPRSAFTYSARKPVPILPLATRISKLASARLEASFTRMKHKLDEAKVLEKLHRLAGHSLRWLRQPMGASHPQRIAVQGQAKSLRPGQNATR